jgi:hypothetical protein
MIAAIALIGQISLGAEVICLKNETLKIPEDRGFSIGPARRKTIDIFIPIDCKKKTPLIPKSDAQLLQFLDFALPVDLKSGAVQGCGSIATGRTFATVYRYDADWVALGRLAQVWQASKSCQTILAKDKSLLPIACTVSFYNLYRANFMQRDNRSVDREPAQIPTAEEMEEREKWDPICK